MNQCDGCMRGLPIDAGGNHRDPQSPRLDSQVFGCTAHLYRGDDLPDWICRCVLCERVWLDGDVPQHDEGCRYHEGTEAASRESSNVPDSTEDKTHDR